MVKTIEELFKLYTESLELERKTQEFLKDGLNKFVKDDNRLNILLMYTILKHIQHNVEVLLFDYDINLKLLDETKDLSFENEPLTLMYILDHT